MELRPARTSTSKMRSAVRGPRMLAPDLARGLTLLGIAGANVVTAWAPAEQSIMGGVVDNSLWDKICILIGAVFFHVRGLPMFSTMLGFGIGLISLSLYRRGFPLNAARKVLFKRYAYLAIFGLIHTVFLFFGDIMLFYGLAGILVGLMISASDKVLLWLSGLFLALSSVGYAVAGIFMIMAPSLFDIETERGNSGGGMNVAITTGETINTYVDQLRMGSLMVLTMPVMLPMIGMSLMPLMLIGIVAARHGIVQEPEKHLKVLRISAAVALIVMLVIGVPLGLAGMGLLPAEWELGLFMINTGVGNLTGPGIIAMIVLASMKIQRKLANPGYRLPVVIDALAALGKRSMTGYLLQSVFFTIFVTRYGLGIGQGDGAAIKTGIAVLVWIASILICYGLERAGIPGPFERLHRRLAYGKNGLPAHYEAPGALSSSSR